MDAKFDIAPWNISSNNNKKKKDEPQTLSHSCCVDIFVMTKMHLDRKTCIFYNYKY